MEYAARIPTPQALVNNALHLISFPEICMRLQETIEDPMHTRKQLAEVVAYDSALSARVWRIANSSCYNFPRKLETIESAVGILGELDLRNLVLATTLIGSMSSLDCADFDIDEFWLHSLRCGITGRLITASTGGYDSETLFLAGILHDIGILVLYQQDASLSSAINRQINQHHQLRDQAERELLGFDHAEIGYLLIQSWGLPENLCELVHCHHQYQLSRQYSRDSQILALANLLAEQETELDMHNDIRYVSMIEQLGLSPGSLDEIVQSAAQQCDEIRSIILAS